jgi:Leucine-rich repeat (LRR) protein
MPYELYSDKEFYKFDKLNDVPKDIYDKITSIEAFEMRIRDINNIGLKFPNLEELNVSLNNIKILDLSYFRNLKTLVCNKSKTEEIIGFEYCYKLESVEMQSNKLTTISTNINIKTLILPGNNLKYLPDFENLEILNIVGCNELTCLGKMPKLKELYIYNTNVYEMDFYMDLETLDCSYNTAIKKIHPFPKLKELICYNSHIKKNNLPYLPSLDFCLDKKKHK